jgi:futalosine hydrolase
VKTVLIVATQLEADFFASLELKTVVTGIGAVNAALSTLEYLYRQHPDIILHVGIAGAYPQSGLEPGMVACASEMIFAGMGAEDGTEFIDLEGLGFPLGLSMVDDGLDDGLDDRDPRKPYYNQIPAWTGSRNLAAQLGLACGPFLTLETATGSAETLAKIQRRFPNALAEDMEGAGVAHVARRMDYPILELRGISNLVGPRDRSSWKIGPALLACKTALEQALPLLEPHFGYP